MKKFVISEKPDGSYLFENAGFSTFDLIGIAEYIRVTSITQVINKQNKQIEKTDEKSDTI